VEGIAENIQAVTERIKRACSRAKRDPLSISLVAVTKGIGIEAVREAYNAGLRVFGENYMQEAKSKIQGLPGDVVWHFIGHLQRNKAKAVVGSFEVIHSIDSLRLAEEVAIRAREKGVVQKVFLQVNIAGESAKSGCGKNDALQTLDAMSRMEGLELQGLMCIPPISEDAGASRPFFRELREIRDRAAEMLKRPIEALGLSMGMSADFEVAIEEGATAIRVGTAIFGPRN